MPDHLAEAILAADKFSHPWPFIVIRNALTEEDHVRLLRERTVKPVKMVQGRLTRNLDPNDYFSRIVSTPAVKEALFLQCGFRGECWPRILCDVEGFEMPIHTDVEKRAVTSGIFQIYITEDVVPENGTKLWLAGRADREGSPAVASFAPNTGYAFKRGPSTWHSCGPFVSDRWSLLAPHMEYT